MGRASSFRQSDVTKALKAAAAAGVRAAVRIRPGEMVIVPLDQSDALSVADDIDERLARFAEG